MSPVCELAIRYELAESIGSYTARSVYDPDLSSYLSMFSRWTNSWLTPLLLSTRTMPRFLSVFPAWPESWPKKHTFSFLGSGSIPKILSVDTSLLSPRAAVICRMIPDIYVVPTRDQELCVVLRVIDYLVCMIAVSKVGAISNNGPPAAFAVVT